jgi:zinc/manganese transport system ATP-binding protein
MSGGPKPIVLDRVALAHGPIAAARDISGVLAPGSLTAVIGPNGAGKSTLLRAIAGLHPLAGGTIDRGGMARADIALLPQGSRLDRSFPISCRDVVALGAVGRVGAFRSLADDGARAADRALARVGLAEQADRPIGALSAGQFQRVLFARLIVQDAPVLLLDEPFAAVDASTQDDLLAIVRGWHKEGRTVAAVLHDLDLAHDAFPRTLLLDGRVVAWGPTAAALSEANRHRAGLPRQGWHSARVPA